MTESRSAAPLTRPLLILTALFLLSLPLVTPRLYASDEVQYFSFLRSLWFDRDVEFGNEYQYFYDSGVVRYPGFYDTFLERRTETGQHITFATIGSAILWSPFYAAADAIVRARRAMGAAIEADGFSQPYVSAVAYGSAVYGWLSLVVSMLIVRRVLSGARGVGAIRSGGTDAARSHVTPADRGDVGWLALGAALAVWIGTPLFFYMYIAPPMSHACSAFAVALFVLAWLHVRETWSLRGMLLLGALAALMAMVREQELFVAVGPAVDWLWTLIQRAQGTARGHDTMRVEDTASPRQLIVGVLAGVAAFAIAYTPQLVAYSVLHGYPGPSRLVRRKMYWLAPHALGVLASPQHGLLFWTPLLVLSLAGLAMLALRGLSPWTSTSKSEPRSPGASLSDASPGSRHARAVGQTGDRGAFDVRRIGVCLLLMVAAQVYVSGSVDSWTVAGAFGQRRFVGLTAIFVLGTAVVIRSLPARWPRRVALATATLAIWWNLGLMAQFGTGLMDRQRLELGRNAYHTFVTIPKRLPELVYRYVFERRSFFKTNV